MKNILKINELEKEIRELHDQNKSIVLTGGCFDVLHIGHITLLEKAKEAGDVVVVLLESDQKIQQLKGEKRPLHTQEQRAHMLLSLKYVDYVVMLPSHMQNTDYDEVVKMVQPAIIAATEGDPGVEHKKRQASLVGAKLIFVTKVIPNISTSTIIHHLLQEQ